jgi:hypothetical protein
MDALSSTLTQLAGAAFRWSAIGFLVLNGAAAAVVWITRDRRAVNRWTSPLLAANLLLLGTGLGVPLVAHAVNLVVRAATATGQPRSVTVEIDAP